MLYNQFDCPLCLKTNETPHESLFNFKRRSFFDTSLSTWESKPGPLFLSAKYVEVNSTERQMRMTMFMLIQIMHWCAQEKDKKLQLLWEFIAPCKSDATGPNQEAMCGISVSTTKIKYIVPMMKAILTMTFLNVILFI